MAALGVAKRAAADPTLAKAIAMQLAQTELKSRTITTANAITTTDTPATVLAHTRSDSQSSTRKRAKTVDHQTHKKPRKRRRTETDMTKPITCFLTFDAWDAIFYGKRDERRELRHSAFGPHRAVVGRGIRFGRGYPSNSDTDNWLFGEITGYDHEDNPTEPLYLQNCSGPCHVVSFRLSYDE